MASELNKALKSQALYTWIFSWGIFAIVGFFLGAVTMPPLPFLIGFVGAILMFVAGCDAKRAYELCK